MCVYPLLLFHSTNTTLTRENTVSYDRLILYVALPTLLIAHFILYYDQKTSKSWLHEATIRSALAYCATKFTQYSLGSHWANDNKITARKQRAVTKFDDLVVIHRTEIIARRVLSFYRNTIVTSMY